VKGFREFILRGNLVDLAVAVVIGAAFGAVVAALVADLITPLIAAIGGQAGLQRPRVHRQQVEVQVRRLSQRAADVRDHRRRRLLPHHQACCCAAGAVLAQEGGGPAARVSGVPIRRSRRCAALRALHRRDPPDAGRVGPPTYAAPPTLGARAGWTPSYRPACQATRSSTTAAIAASPTTTRLAMSATRMGREGSPAWRSARASVSMSTMR
jgi:hypothetical protein